ncbi:MAG TPA: AAA domain-containing protein, partial [Kineosporiaceae bacterium]|nr:AAA domain-containing protein [Kineosporiaceae bacterium]
MTEPDRRRRAQDLAEVTERLKTYRDQPVDFDLAEVTGLASDRIDRRTAVLASLRDRLFDLSRRNRLLYFRPTQTTLDLTEASVPLLLDARNVRPEQLFTWQPRVIKAVLSGKPITLGSVLRWEEAPYAAGVLDGLISQARRDRSEYGQAQLRLVVAFLRWHDLKGGDRDERISSPLLLLPVTLSKQRGVRDSYLLQAPGSIAAVNPALRRHLSQLYGLELPESVDLATRSVADVHADLARQIARTEPAVTLTLQERPRIELVHQRALLRAQAFTRRAERGRLTLGARSYAYSYRRRDYQPLGLQVFRDRVAYRPAPLGVAFGQLPETRQVGVAAAPEPPGPAQSSAQTYLLDRGGQGNPYAWDVDLCALTLASVNYRTMSLVRDYDALTGADPGCPPFEQLIGAEPRQLPEADQPDLPVHERYVVVPADGSQVAALARSRQGGSFVIQGPPGTGKSQTITNLIADYVAAGRRVLFVCQKRAAIDVVHARLRGQGLGELSCLIHDSQADKKAFVLGLGQTYQAWTTPADGDGGAEQRRADLVAAIEAQLERVRRYEAALAGTQVTGTQVTGTQVTGTQVTGTRGAGPATDRPGEAVRPFDPSPRDLLERLVELRDKRWDGAADPAVRRVLPRPPEWWAAREAVARVGSALASAGAGRVLASSPVRYLSPQVLASPRPDAEASVRAAAALEAVDRLISTLASAAGSRPEESTAMPAHPAGQLPQLSPDRLDLPTVQALVEVGRLLGPLAERGRAAALLVGSPSAQLLGSDAAALVAARNAAERATADAAGWSDPPDPADARSAMDVARRREGSPLRWFDSSWRSVRRTVRQRFDPGPRAVSPTVRQALEILVAVHQAAEERSRLENAAEQAWGRDDLPELIDRLDAVRSGPADPAALGAAIATAEDSRLVAAMIAAASPAAAARAAVDTVLVDVEQQPLSLLRGVLTAVGDRSAAGLIRAISPSLVELDANPQVAAALRRTEADPDQIEYAVAEAGLDDLAARLPAMTGFDGEQLAAAVRATQELLPQLYAADASVIVARVRTRFVAGVQHSTRSVTGMSAEDRARKQAWSVGRRELEHEFGKVRAYRSIRELASGAPGAVVAALRPVWLMSPTSVSDALPLDPTLFDVVIYDEASQIPLEEAVPAMHRARQVIVVGDQMQLPPTQYFTARGGDTDPGADPQDDNGDACLPLPDDDEREIGVVLDGDSLLATCAVRLPSTMLTWHYRSRYEALIAFSNAAFYDGRLSTVPDRTVAPPGRPPIEVDVSAAEAAGGSAEAVPAEAVQAGLDALLDRSISVHRMRGAVYRRRTNAGEAAYIAALVRALLTHEGEPFTVGVVAFSQAQQTAIERALDELAEQDQAFAQRYEQELLREDDDQ